MTLLKNIRTIYEDQESFLLVTESTPQLRTIKIEHPSINDLPKINYTFYLSFPYMQFYLYRGVLHLTFSKKSVQSLEGDEVCFPFLPNIYTNKLSVCLSVGTPWENNSMKAMEMYIDGFWNSSFYVYRNWYGCWMVPEAFKRTYLEDFPTELEFVDNETETDFCEKTIEQFIIWEEGTRKEGGDYIFNVEWPSMFKNLPYLLRAETSFVETISDLDAAAISSICNDG